MHRIDTPTAQIDKFGQGKNGFTNGDPATGRRATDLNSDMWDAVQEEVCTVIEQSGVALNKAQHDQLYKAIMQLIANQIPDALLKKNNLSDVIDKALARANLELKSAAVRDVQSSRDDLATGRVLVNGGALALRTVAASGGGGAYTDDCNNLPANSVSFVYGSAKNSPGFEASVLDFSGLEGAYRTQIAASYSDGGKRISIRTCNGDNQAWNAWKPILTVDGGSFNSTFKFGRVETIPTEKNMSALFNQTGGAGTIVSGAEYNWYNDKITTGITRGPSDSAWGYAIRLNGNDLLTIDTSGSIRNSKNIYAGEAVFESGGLVRVYSPNNMPPQQDLSSYATQAWVLGNFVQDIILGAEVTVPTAYNGRLPAGYVCVAVQNEQGTIVSIMGCPIQKKVNGNYYTIQKL